MLRRALIAVVAIVLGTVLAGCVGVKSYTPSQPNALGGVQIATVLCASGSTGCGNGNSNSAAPTDDTPIQLLVGYRVSTGSVPPTTLRFFDDDGLGPLFTRSADYTAELQRIAPAPEGSQWFGYISETFTYNATTSLTSLAIITRFGLPGNAGTPIETFRVNVVAGFRIIGGENSPATRPVVCGTGPGSGADFGFCIDSPLPAELSSNTLLDVRDLGVTAGSAPTTPAGQTATVPFSLLFRGATAPPLLLTLSAGTTVPGATLVVTPATFTPSSSEPAPASVQVAVPPGTPGGTYAVTLTATAGNESRTATGAVVVPGPPAPAVTGGAGTSGPPALTNLSASPRTIGRGRRAGPATLTVTLSQPGTLKVAVTRSARGRRNDNGRCVAPTAKLIANGAPRCTRFVSVTTITKANQGAGARTLTFSGRGRPPGRYRLSVTLQAAGQVSLPANATVTVSS